MNITEKKEQIIFQKNSFIASLGHDLKNPTIAQIRGLELLLNGNFGELSYKQKEIIEAILESCKYMKEMLASLLEIYKNSNGKMKLEIEEFLFSDILKECMAEMIYLAKDKNLKIIIQNNLKNQNINADKIQIKRVLINLISNAIKYAYSDTDLILELYSKGEFSGFMFKNKSPYIPKEKQSNLFSRYVTYSSEYEQTGFGLGLYNSKQIIEAHNGNIYFKSNEDNTNCFGFEIPTAGIQELKTLSF